MPLISPLVFQRAPAKATSPVLAAASLQDLGPSGDDDADNDDDEEQRDEGDETDDHVAQRVVSV